MDAWWRCLVETRLESRYRNINSRMRRAMQLEWGNFWNPGNGLDGVTDVPGTTTPRGLIRRSREEGGENGEEGGQRAREQIRTFDDQG